MKIRKGDTLVLKSGGPRMTAGEPTICGAIGGAGVLGPDYGDVRALRCHWFDSTGHYHSAEFHTDMPTQAENAK